VPLRACLAGCAVALVALVPAGAATTNLRISGATAKERALMRQVVARVQPTAIDSIRFLKPRKWKPIPKHSVLLDLGSSSSAAPADALTVWQAWLIIGVYRDRAAKAHLRRVAFYSLARIGQDESRLGRSPQPPPPRAKPGQAAAIEAVLREGAVASGAAVDEVKVLTPLGVAPRVTLRFADPAQYLKNHFDTFVSALHKIGRTEGVYLSGVDTDGNPVFRFGSARRADSVEIWVRPGLETCNAFFDHSFPTNPPPCPA
jgi:hypothetical protein